MGAADDAENLIHLHALCHKQEHSKPKLKAGNMALCRVIGDCHARFLGEGREVTLKPYPIVPFVLRFLRLLEIHPYPLETSC